MSREPVTLIFDIGKTTKKALLFDGLFNVLEEHTEVLPETIDDDGFPTEDLALVSDWVLQAFKYYTTHPHFKVTHCNISAYGASLAHLDKNSERIKPFYNYIKPLPASSLAAFRSKYDKDNGIARTTASPLLGLLNSGLQLFWLKREKASLFESIGTSLHLPQYFTWLLTGMRFTDITSIGCHTMLWDFNKNSYHEWVSKEQLIILFPKIYQADHTFNITIDQQTITMGIGVHDSSAALMPYLVSQDQPFLLLSTGTWNICFNPFNSNPLTHEELAADCLSYLTFDGKPVKASRIFLGHEHELQAAALTKYFGVPSNTYSELTFDDGIYDEVTSPEFSDRPFYPVGMEGTGPIPNRSLVQTDLSAFKNFEQAYMQLVRYLVLWQLMSIDLVDPAHRVHNIIVVGGFTKNSIFLEMLKRLCPSRNVMVSDHPRASALGAAWLVNGSAAYKGKEHLLTVKNA
ncbi:MAG: FGGY family carbohydrate kinase [Chryseolinea sp.]